MPKPIVVIHMGYVSQEKVDRMEDFLRTSKLAAPILEEYHFILLKEPPEGKAYILSIDKESVVLDPAPTTLKKLFEALDKVSPLAKGGVVSGPSFGNTDHGPEMIVPFPSASQKVKDALKQMHAIRDAARFLIAELKKGWTAKEIAEWYNVPDIKIGDSWPKTGYTPKEVREMEDKSTVKDPNEKASFFGYNIRRSTMQDIESAILTGSLLRLGSISGNELIIRREYTDQI